MSTTYAIVALVCAAVVAIILNRTEYQQSNTHINRVFHTLLIACLFYTFSDMCFGIFSARRSQGTGMAAIFVYVAYCLMAYTSYAWYKFTVNYFKAKSLRDDKLLKLAFGVMVGDIAILFTNLFNKQVFVIEKGCVFTPGPLRIAFFGAQLLIYIGMTIYSLVHYAKRKSNDDIAYLRIAVSFSLLPLCGCLLQLIFTTFPATTVGYMLGTLVIYTFTITQEREDLLVSAKQMEIDRENGKKARVDYEIIKRLADDVEYVAIIDNNNVLNNYSVSGLFSQYIDSSKPEIGFFDFDSIMRKIIPEKDYSLFATRASKEIVINRLKLEDSYSFMVTMTDGTDEYPYRISFFKHPTELDRIIMSIRNITDQLREVEELEDALKRANTDGLTGLLNKTAFEEQVESYLSKNGSAGVGMIFLDLDHFKEVNDELGHAEGDQVLKDTADRIRSVFRKDDLVSRQGGDEFCVFIPAINKTVLEDKVVKVHKALVDTRKGSKGEVKITSSIGCVFCTDSQLDFASLRAKADESMYNIKKNGRDGYEMKVF